VGKRDLAVKDGKIFSFRSMPAAQVIDLSGLYVAPGLIDSHLHLEGLHLLPEAYGGAFLAHGTTTIITDLHEIANAGGLEGVIWYIDLLRRLPLDVFVMAPSCVPSCPFERGVGTIGLRELKRLKDMPRVIGLGEVMNVPGVQKRDSSIMRKIRLFTGKPIDGHAPQLRGTQLTRYLSAGICSDHETTNLDEGEEKLAAGMHLFLRMGSASKDLKRLIPLIEPHVLPLLSLCTDDLSAADLAEYGHIDSLLRYLVGQGISLLDALKLATMNAASYFCLVDRNNIGVGKKADLMVFDSPKNIDIKMVIKNGQIAYREGDILWPEPRPVKVPRTQIRIADFGMADLPQPAKGGKIHVIKVEEGTLITNHLVEDARVKDGILAADPEDGLCLAYAFDRYEADPRFGFGFVRGFSIHQGAIGTTYAHDSHNMLIVGDNENDVFEVLQCLKREGGGMAASRNGQIDAFIPMPHYGIISDLAGPEFLRREAGLRKSIAKMGIDQDNAFFQLSFLSLPVIPSLRLTTGGLFDVSAEQHIEASE
jgi:adenine deaminase